jgi:branched-chain amino acid transport system substrate-binding protein
VLVKVFPDVTSQKSVVVRKFQSTMKASSGNEACMNSGSALEGWLNGQIMIEGIKNTGKGLSREYLRAGLGTIRLTCTHKIRNLSFVLGIG